MEITKHKHAPRVRVGMARTINLGGYESFRVDVGLESDVFKDETVEAAYDRVQKEVERRLEAICAPVESALEKKSSKERR